MKPSPPPSYTVPSSDMVPPSYSTSPASTVRKRLRRAGRLIWAEFVIRIVAFLACIPALVLPIIVSSTVKHALTVSYAAAIFGLLLNAFEIFVLLFMLESHYSTPQGCCIGIMDFIAMMLFAGGAVGALLDGVSWEGGENTSSPLNEPEAWLLTSIGSLHLVLFAFDCIICCVCFRRCCSPKGRKKQAIERRNQVTLPQRAHGIEEDLW